MKKQASTRTTASQARRGMGAEGEKLTPLRSMVLQAARRRCDDMQDSPAAREQMKREVVDTPAELLGDLLVALTETRPVRTEFSSPISTQPERSNP